MKNCRIATITVQKFRGGAVKTVMDEVAVEEPLGIQLCYSTATGFMKKEVAVTMRTPGNDEELATGFLFTEGIINSYESIASIQRSRADENVILVQLREGEKPLLSNLSRNFYSSSSCGICGKAG